MAVKTCLMIGGSGMAGHWIRLWTENFSDRVKLIGLVDVNKEVLERQGEALGLSSIQRFTDFHEACARVKADFCGIAIPPQFHSPAAIAAMENGMPVICEKPIADTLQAAKAVVRTAQRWMKSHAQFYLLTPASRCSKVAGLLFRRQLNPTFPRHDAGEPMKQTRPAQPAHALDRKWFLFFSHNLPAIGD